MEEIGGSEKASTPTTEEAHDGADASAIGGQLQDLPTGYYRSPKFVGSIIGVILMANSLYLGFVLPANILSVIDADIGPDPNYLLISTAFTLTAGVGLTLVGRLGDIFGRRYFLIGGQTLGFIGALICATAKNIPAVIGGTVLVGLAGAVQLTFTFVVAELVANKHRAKVDAFLFMSIIPLSSMGPAFARLLVSNTRLSWRWNYYLNAISCGLSVVFFILFYFPPKFSQLTRNASWRSEIKKFDYGGFILYSGGLVLVLLGLSWGGSAYPWHSAHVIAALVVGFVTLIAFAIYEIYMPLEQALVPMSLFKITNYSAVVVTASVGTMIYFSMNILWPLQIAALYTTDNIQIGWLSCTTGAAVVIGQVVSGLVFKRIGHVKWQLVGCCVGFTVFLGGMAAVNASNRGLAIALTILAGLCVGALELITIIIAGLVCNPGDIGLASGLLGSFRQVSGSIAASIYVSILTNRLTTTLPANVAPAALNAGLPSADLPALFAALATGTATAMEAVPGITPTVIAAVGDAVKVAYSQAFKTVYLTSIAFGGLSIIAALFITSIDDSMTDFVARKIRGVETKPIGSVRRTEKMESNTIVLGNEEKTDKVEEVA
ncbi:siderophore iron transporter [Hyaloscypha bicolor E]|uniref:Siderophore iron transporter n=1 Tax=Hyaloscypha bicolor E TaxID=1095630 RepID=A0A2J6SY46_9HELO|nr:siderophore iron transporter [Hyaloscypha bicolor E]PMD55689.1 siderophore iron transporter [Hyaloscypha bicolor E]